MFDSNEMEWNKNQFNKPNCMELYGDIKGGGGLPNVPEERGLKVQNKIFVDAYHAGYHVMSRLHIKIVLFLNNPPNI